MTAAAIAALVVEMCGGTPLLATTIAPVIAQESALAQLDARIVVAVMKHESNCRSQVRGAKGELGLFQLKRGTWALTGAHRLSDEQILRPATNARLGIRHLARVRTLCGGGEPAKWLSVYSGRRWCRESPYSRRVLLTVNKTRR